MTPLLRRRRRHVVTLLLIAVGIGLATAVTQGAAQPSGELSDAEEDAALELALNGALPSGIDLTGTGVRAESVSEGATLASLLQGKRIDAVNAYAVIAPTGKSRQLASCRDDRCAQAQIYNFTDSVTVTAIVNLTDDSIIDVQTWPHAVPEVNTALRELVLEIVDESPAVQAELAGRDYVVAMDPAPAHHSTGPCAADWCVLVSLGVEGVGAPQEALLVMVNLTEQTTADVFWRSTLRKGG